MRFAILDPVGDGLSWSSRLVSEGAEVLHYIHEHQSREIGEGIVPKTGSMHHLLAWAKQEPTVAVAMFSGLGKRSDKVPVGLDDFKAAGVPTVLGGGFCDRLEKDRAFGIQFAEKAGVRIPPYFEFSTISEAIRFAKQQKDKRWYFKTDASIDTDATKGGTGEQLVRYLENLRNKVGDNKRNIMQMQIPGVAVSTAAWFNGREFIMPFEGTIERKKLMNGDVGPSTGCSINVVWMYQQDMPRIAEELNFAEISHMLLEHGAPAGLYDINAIVSSEAGPWGPAHVPYFLEWTPRCGWDSEATSHRLLQGMGLSQFLWRLGRGTLEAAPFRTDRIGMAIRLSVPPYPYQQLAGLKKTPRGNSLYGFDSVWQGGFSGYGVAYDKKRGYYMATDDGIIGLSLAYGTNLEAMNKRAISFAKSLEPTSLMYRTDAADALGSDARKLRSMGYEIPSMVVQ